MRISGRGNYKYEEGAGICFATSLQIHLFSVVILSFLQPEVIADFLERLFLSECNKHQANPYNVAC